MDPKLAWLGWLGACAGWLRAGWAELGWLAAASVADRVPGWAGWRVVWLAELLRVGWAAGIAG